MNLQYISDNDGKTTGVFIPIKDWEQLKQEIEGLREMEDQLINIPHWHKELVRSRMDEYKKNPDRVLNWDEVQHNFRVD